MWFKIIKYSMQNYRCKYKTNYSKNMYNSNFANFIFIIFIIQVFSPFLVFSQYF